MDLGRSSKGHATGWASRCTSKGGTPLKPFSWPSRTGSTNSKKVGSLTGLSVHTSTAQRNPQENQAGHFGTGFRIILGLPPHHSHSTGHPASPECFTIVDRESQGVTRNIKEAMYIHVNDPSPNRNLGKYQLPHIWNEVSQNTTSLQLNYQHYHLPPHGPPHIYTTQYNGGHAQFQLVSIISCGGTFPFPHTTLY